jgi:hypothetical protein
MEIKALDFNLFQAEHTGCAELRIHRHLVVLIVSDAVIGHGKPQCERALMGLKPK